MQKEKCYFVLITHEIYFYLSVFHFLHGGVFLNGRSFNSFVLVGVSGMKFLINYEILIVDYEIWFFLLFNKWKKIQGFENNTEKLAKFTGGARKRSDGVQMPLKNLAFLRCYFLMPFV